MANLVVKDIQKLELYLPSLDNLVQHVDFLGYNDPRVIRLISNLKIRWTSPLSSTCSLNIMGPKFFQIDSLRFELGLVLFSYGSLLRERASQVLHTDLVQSATLFRKAAGVYQYLGHDVLPFIRAKPSPHGPPEATSSVSSVMSLICLAEAQVRVQDSSSFTCSLIVSYYVVKDARRGRGASARSLGARRKKSVKSAHREKNIKNTLCFKNK
ncbi:putative BRO1 domain-containing protein [Helianthus annuus]|uniref:BRO1 domain-containing protein n=1 Tax=Helianthus annuus TaxID=4232 RepID=A0A9K3GWE1_HELAN|nr:putative BRO1 domain-containing protein [Helianthus annuus]KAJ0430895.1 putative BRO1 domain-containing protein [Helianthus annuus]KAJ0449350.1 putative BRO1 domain-containing protein [Helianthus annuus]